MSESIYMYEGVQKTLVEEKFIKPLGSTIQEYNWKSGDGSVGFNIKGSALDFLKLFLDNKPTVLYPGLKLIDTNENIEKNIHNLQGITFFNNSSLIKEEFSKYLLHLNKGKKNALLERYGKPIEVLQTPVISGWYNKERKYTEAFSNFCLINNVKFIVWAYSDSGIYFFNFCEIIKVDSIVKELSDKLDLNFVKVNDIDKMPYH